MQAETLDHRASIAAFLDRLADDHAAKGLGRTAASALRAASSSVAAMLDIQPGARDIASPTHHLVHQCCAALSPAVTVADVLSHSKVPEVARVRFAASYVAKQRFMWSDQRLGEVFLRDRSSISNALKRAEDFRIIEDLFREATDTLSAQALHCEHCFAPLETSI